MSKRSDQDLINDIENAVNRILKYTVSFNYSKFLADLKTQDAVVRNFEIIGEASKSISKAFRTKHKNIPWNDMACFRDKLIHHYSGVNYDIVWDIIENSLPDIRKQIRKFSKK